jgi:hypothetical protein
VICQEGFTRHILARFEKIHQPGLAFLIELRDGFSKLERFKGDPVFLSLIPGSKPQDGNLRKI